MREAESEMARLASHLRPSGSFLASSQPTTNNTTPAPVNTSMTLSWLPADMNTARVTSARPMS